MSTEGETPSFCLTVQVLDMSTLGDVADVNPVIKFLPYTVNHMAQGAHMPPMPHDFGQLRQRITEAVAAIDHEIL
jgi:hypothetical protein